MEYNERLEQAADYAANALRGVEDRSERCIIIASAADDAAVDRSDLARALQGRRQAKHKREKREETTMKSEVVGVNNMVLNMNEVSRLAQMSNESLNEVAIACNLGPNYFGDIISRSARGHSTKVRASTYMAIAEHFRVDPNSIILYDGQQIPISLPVSVATAVIPIDSQMIVQNGNKGPYTGSEERLLRLLSAWNEIGMEDLQRRIVKKYLAGFDAASINDLMGL